MMVCVGCYSQADCSGSDSSREFLFTIQRPKLAQVPLPTYLQPALCGDHQGQHRLLLLHFLESKICAVNYP